MKSKNTCPLQLMEGAKLDQLEETHRLQNMILNPLQLYRELKEYRKTNSNLKAKIENLQISLNYKKKELQDTKYSFKQNELSFYSISNEFRENRLFIEDSKLKEIIELETKFKYQETQLENQFKSLQQKKQDQLENFLTELKHLEE